MEKTLFSAKNNCDLYKNFVKEHQKSKDNFLSATKAITITNFNKYNSIGDKKHSSTTSKDSNLENLKQEIKYLQNQQFLSLKYRHSTEPDRRQEIQYIVAGKQFIVKKKVPHLEKLKLCQLRRGKLHLPLDKRNFQESKVYSCLNYLQVKDINTSIKQQSLKKKQTPNIVKKYFRLQSSKNMFMKDWTQRQNQNQIRGRSLKSSAQNRPEKQNILIYYF